MKPITPNLEARKQHLKKKLADYIKKYNFKTSRILKLMYKHHKVLNIGEVHGLSSFFAPELVQLTSTSLKPGDVLALEIKYSNQNLLDKYLSANDASAKKILKELIQYPTIKNYKKLLETARYKKITVVFMDKRSDKNYSNSWEVNAEFIKSVENYYGNIENSKKRIIFYSGNAHAEYSHKGNTLGDQLIKRLGREAVATFQVRSIGARLVWLNNNAEFESDYFKINDILKEYSGRTIDLHKDELLFRKLFDFGRGSFKTRPYNEPSDWVIHYK